MKDNHPDTEPMQFKQDGRVSELIKTWRKSADWMTPETPHGYQSGRIGQLKQCADELEAVLATEKPANVATIIGAMLYRVAVTGEHSGNWANNEQVEKATQAILALHAALAAHDQKVRREMLNEAAELLDRWLNEKWIGAPADVIRSLASGAEEKK